MADFAELRARDVRKVYLVTYARADPNLCSTRDEFARKVITSFNFQQGLPRLLHWVVCKEPHEGGGFHFHMALCLSQNKRWGPAKRALAGLGITVHFQDRNDVFNYVGAYIYVCKSDRAVLHSNPHPDLDNVTQFRTAAASAATRRGRNGQRNAQRPKTAKLTNLNVMQIVRMRGIKDDIGLLALAQDNFDQGHTALMEYISNTPERKYKEVIAKVWKAKDARKKLQRRETSRMDKIQAALLEPCIEECGDDEIWLEMGREVLRNNSINAYTFAEAVRRLLRAGRSKGNNILITGPKDCAKTFLLRPLTKIFDCFTNPSSGTYAFVGIQNKEVAFLNDLRYNPVMLPWQDFLNMLEGMELHIPTPKTHYAEDIELVSDIPFFATSIGPVQYTGKSSDPAGEDAMMETRWRHFKFSHSIPTAQQKKFPACPRCFSELITMGIQFD